MKTLHAVSMMMVVTLGVAFFVGFPVCWLWNWIMPSVFGVAKIGFWKAWGILILSSLLFSGRSGSSSSKS